MADARSLLKEQRANRRIVHPHASYTDSGKLICTICRSTIKSESIWNSHVRSQEHTTKLKSIQDQRATSHATVPSRKRKAGSEEEDDEDLRKRTKASEDGDEESRRVGYTVDQEQPAAKLPEGQSTDQKRHVSPDQQSAAPTAPVDEVDEDLLRLQRDLDALENAPSIPTPVIVGAPTISAAPMTAEEVAAQAREDQSIQRDRRHEEIEAEREDAARALEDEFAEMEELEDRVKLLRQKREALRMTGSEAGLGGERDLESTVDAASSSDMQPAFEQNVESSDDSDDVDDWDFGRT